MVVPPHFPVDEPVGITHGSPEQQSALLVQAPSFFTHSPMHLLLTQGLPQQSALVTQLSPAFGILVGSSQSLAFRRQRGIPSASLRQQLSGLLLQ
jgi:hypothetical protein